MWVELADRTFCRRYDPWDVTVGVVLGSAGMMVIDTRASEEEGRELLADLRELDQRLPRWVVNTHPHFDHVRGNAVVAGAAAARVIDRPATVDLGDRTVDVRHLGRGHTGRDLVVTVPGALFTGDLVEESGPPQYDELSHPLDWPATNARLVAMIGEHDRVVPGHGAVVDRAFAVRQQLELEIVARTIRDVHQAGVPVNRALRAGREHWPFPAAGLVDAVLRGYEALATPAAER